MIDFFPEEYKSSSSRLHFGICDTPPPPHQKAYIDEAHGQNWIAVVDNHYRDEITFIPIDNCIEIRRSDSVMDNRCDGFLYYDRTIIFVELKNAASRSKTWIAHGEEQLRVTIGHFENSFEAADFDIKKAYIANSAKPQFRSTMFARMDNFFLDTGYVLRIENRINID